MKKIFLVSLILFLTIVLRFYHFTSNPPGLYWDEAAIGYNAYSILETSKDEWGTRMPLVFRSFDDYKLPGYIYAAVLTEKIFGVNEVGVRIPSVIAGILTVLSLYFLTLSLTHKTKVALITALALAISPWHLQFSRAGFEANLCLFFVVTGLMFFMRWKLFAASIFFAASMYTYHNARIFVPVFGLILLFLYREKLLANLKKTLMVGVFTILILLPLASLSFSKEGYARLDTQSVIHQNGGIFTNLTNNYLAMFNNDFLFFKGDQAGRHSVKKVGELYLWQLPLVFLGIYFMLKQKNKATVIVLSWLALGAIPPAVTSISPHALRGLLEAPVYQLLTGIGLLFIWQKIKQFRFPVAAFFGVIFAYSFLVYLHLYYVHYPTAYSLDWQYGIKDALALSENLSNSYDKIYTYQELPYIHLLFYTKFSPTFFQQSGHNTKVIGKYNWLDTAKYPEKTVQKSLIISPYFLVSANNEGMLREVKLLNGDPMFRLYEL